MINKVLHVEEELKQKIEDMDNESNEIWDENNPQASIDLLIEAYQLIPEPRTRYSEGYNLLKYISIAYFITGNLDESEKWLPEFLESDFNTMGYGESEYLAAKIALKRNNKELAIQHFIVANQKSGGRVFGSDEDDKANYEFFKLHAKEHVRPKGFAKMLKTAQTEIEQENYAYALSLLYDCLNLKLDNPSVHFCKGCCHFELNELDYAADSFTRAYMLEGEAVFKNQNTKYLEFLKTRIELK